MNDDPTTPHEPEIVVLRHVARAGLAAIRTVFAAAGAFGVWSGVFGPPSWTGLDWQQPQVFVFACAGLPLVLPTGWWLGRARWVALGVGAAACLLPMLHGGDHPFGFVLRAFGMLVTCLTMVVWRALWRLTRAD